jgi:hypothetical protein
MADASRIRKELLECQRDKKSGVTAKYVQSIAFPFLSTAQTYK